MNIQRVGKNKRLSRAVVCGDKIYLGAQMPDDLSGGIVDQTRQVLAKVDEMLRHAGTSKAYLLSVTVLLKDLADFEGMNTAWDAWVDQERPPARCSFGNAAIGGPAPGYRVEMTAIAHVPQDQVLQE
jgi:enamine deaminase RidA (YjgF/YER057c/UK114 family)